MVSHESISTGPTVEPRRLGRGISVLGAAMAIGVMAPLVSEAAPADASTLAASFDNFGYPNGDVTGLADDSRDHLMAVSGNFTQWTNPNGTTEHISKLAIIDDRSGELKHTIGNVEGYIRRVVFSGGNFYLGGSFKKIDGQPRNYLAAVRADSGALVNSWKPSAPAEVRTIATKDNRVYAAGYFSAVEAYSADSGAHHVWQQRLQVGADVNVLLPVGNDVYAGGAFESKTGGHYGLVELAAKTGDMVTKFRDRTLRHPGGTCVPAHHPQWRESCKDIVLSLAKSRAGILLVGIGGIHNKILAENSQTGKRRWEHDVVGDVQSTEQVNNDNPPADEVTEVDFHRNSTDNHGHPLATFTAMIHTLSGKFIKTFTALNRLGGGTSNNDGNNGGVGVVLQANGREYVGGGFSEPHDGLEVIDLWK